MTESQWLTSADPSPMLAFLQERGYRVGNPEPLLEFPDIIRDVFGNPWIQYVWQNSEARVAPEERTSLPPASEQIQGVIKGDDHDSDSSGRSISNRDDNNSPTSVRHTESVDQSSPTQCLEAESTLGMGTDRRTVDSRGVPVASHQWQQHGRQSNQSCHDSSRCSSTIPCGRAEGTTDGNDPRDQDGEVRQMPNRVPGMLSKKGQHLPEMCLQTQAVSSQTAIRSDGRVICLDHRILAWSDRTIPNLAQAIIDDAGERECRECDGTGIQVCPPQHDSGEMQRYCIACQGTGKLPGTGILDPGRLAILADAVEEAGCHEEELLRHLRGWIRCAWASDDPAIDHGGKDWKEMACRCHGTGWLRSESVHVVGCWAIELLRGIT